MTLIEANLLGNSNNPWVENCIAKFGFVLSLSGIFIRCSVQNYQL